MRHRVLIGCPPVAARGCTLLLGFAVQLIGSRRRLQRKWCAWCGVGEARKGGRARVRECVRVTGAGKAFVALSARARKMSATAAAKKALREEVRRAIAALSDAEKRRQSALVTEQVLARPEWAAARSVALFLSLRDEPCTRALLEAALASGRDVFAPRVLARRPAAAAHGHCCAVRSAVTEAQRAIRRAPWVREPPRTADDALRR
ncbi:5-formyltetrahydrofolate cyclo-ligase, partial [Gryllus bimaculatus]